MLLIKVLVFILVLKK